MKKQIFPVDKYQLIDNKCVDVVRSISNRNKQEWTGCGGGGGGGFGVPSDERGCRTGAPRAAGSDWTGSTGTGATSAGITCTTPPARRWCTSWPASAWFTTPESTARGFTWDTTMTSSGETATPASLHVRGFRISATDWIVCGARKVRPDGWKALWVIKIQRVHPLGSRTTTSSSVIEFGSWLSSGFSGGSERECLSALWGPEKTSSKRERDKLFWMKSVEVKTVSPSNCEYP